MGAKTNPMEKFQLVTHVHRFRMLNALDMVQIHPSVYNVPQTLRVEVSTSGFNSRANYESEISYCIHTHGPDLQRLQSLEQLKCSNPFYP